MKRQFIAYFFFVAWDCISLGVHICLRKPNIEIHIPFGFIRVGWELSDGRKPINLQQIEFRQFGLTERYKQS